MKNSLIGTVAEYYDAKLQKHGATAKGVDWNGAESQELRFDQMLKLLGADKDLADLRLADLGCGYGAFLEYIERAGYHGFKYSGYDVSEEMCRVAQARWKESEHTEWLVSSSLQKQCDYAIASGIFSVKLDVDALEWKKHIFSVIDNMNQFSCKGFAFNCLTSYSDPEKMQDHLFYASPMEIFDHCKQNFSRNVALLHDYELYEFTILVRK